jgi:phosphoribosyl-ATP pyrophosphohydrolase
MKTRVWKYGDWYYPQYKGLVFWKFFYQYDDVVKYKSKEEAVEHVLNDKGEKYEEVVWESK